MRYLKKYSLFESNSKSDEVQWIKDCLIDLQDAGCDINIGEYSIQVDDYPSIEQSKSMKPAEKSKFSSFKKVHVVPGIVIRIHKNDLIPIEVGDNLLMIDSYLKERGYVGYNAYDYDNPYSQSRYQVRVDARLEGERNMFENEISSFAKMLDRLKTNAPPDAVAPFDTIEVRYFRPKKDISSIKESYPNGPWSNIDELEGDVMEIFQELEDEGVKIDIERVRKDVQIEPEKFYNKTRTDIFLEVYMSRPWGSPDRIIPGVVNPEGGYPGNLLFWYEIKDSIFRLVDWYYSTSGYDPVKKDSVRRVDKDNSPLRFMSSGIEIAVGFTKEEDFKGIGDYTSFTNFRIMIKL